MARFALSRKFKLRLLLTLLIPGFIGLITWQSRLDITPQSSTVLDSEPLADKNSKILTFIDAVALPGTGNWVTTASGLKYIDLILGQGPTPQIGQRLACWFILRLENGKVIASSRLNTNGRGLDTLSYICGYTPLPPGWNEAISTIKVGGLRRFVLPPNLAYGNATLGGSLPANSTFVVDVQLLYLDPKILSKDDLSR